MLMKLSADVPRCQSRMWSIAAEAAEAADDAPRALMMAAPRCCTVGMKVSSYHLRSTRACAGLPSTVQKFRSGYCVDCLLYTSDAADERSSVDLGGRRI